jgi:hypothetical protein
MSTIESQNRLCLWPRRTGARLSSHEEYENFDHENKIKFQDVKRRKLKYEKKKTSKQACMDRGEQKFATKSNIHPKGVNRCGKSFQTGPESKGIVFRISLKTIPRK